MTQINWRIGVEIELLAPKGKSRLDFANAISKHCNGSVKRFFHPQTEPSLVEGRPIFHNLTLGYEVLDGKQNQVAQCVDDLTLQDDLNSGAEPMPNWYRIVSDDERLLRLIKQQTDPNLSLDKVMNPIAKLFGTSPELGEGGMIRVNDNYGASIAIAAPLPGERERPCELITPPMDDDQERRLDDLLSIARALEYKAPLEGATHIHFDASKLQSAHVITNIVNLYTAYGVIISKLVGTNPNCRRLGNWPETLIETVNSKGFRDLSWSEAQSRLKALRLTKYCDLNLVNCIHNFPDKNTVEVRILPVWLESKPILEAAQLFAALFELAMKSELISNEPSREFSPSHVEHFLELLPLSMGQVKHWQNSMLSAR